MDFQKIPYNLEVSYDENLRDIPLFPREMEEGIKWLSQMLDNEEEPLKRAKIMGYLGGLCRILRRLDEAEQHLQKAWYLYETHDKWSHRLVIQIRLAHTLQWKEDFSRAEKMFLDALQKCEKEDFKHLRDFAHQHYGKCLFDQGKFEGARDQFLLALSLRKEKGDQSLIASTETALASTLKRLQ